MGSIAYGVLMLIHLANQDQLLDVESLRYFAQRNCDNPIAVCVCITQMFIALICCYLTEATHIEWQYIYATLTKQ